MRCAGTRYKFRMLRTIEDAFQKSLTDAYLEGGDERALLEGMPSAFAEIRPFAAKQLLKALKRDARRMLKERRADTAAFERRNFKRWRKAFDLYEMLLVILGELGAEHDKDARPEARKTDDLKFEALAQIYPRAMLIGQEILCLLRGGYPDAALTRWRSLFEFTVTAQFINQNDQETALFYLASFDFKALRAAREHDKHAKRANLEPFTPEALAGLESRAKAIEHVVRRPDVHLVRVSRWTGMRFGAAGRR